jgi:hypothetical protein
VSYTAIIYIYKLSVNIKGIEPNEYKIELQFIFLVTMVLPLQAMRQSWSLQQQEFE